MTPSPTHVVLMPSYNAGPRLLSTVGEALRHWSPIWVVIDGSTDGSAEAICRLAAGDPRIRVTVRRRNGGKGAAIASALPEIQAAGFTHVLSMDSDGQHPADCIAEFMAASASHPGSLVLGRPVFGAEAPFARLQGRKLSVALAWIEILGTGIDDPLFGFRVYPVGALRQAFGATRHARRFDFDHEIAVRMFWAGVPVLNKTAPCRYLTREQGGVSHFHYLRDNLALFWLHVRLLAELFPWRLVGVWRARTRHAVRACTAAPLSP